MVERDSQVTRAPEKKIELTPERKEEVRLQIGNILFDSFYNKEEDSDAFLSFPEQDYFIKKVVTLAYEHSDDPAVLMSKAHSYAVRNPEEIERLRTIIALGRKKFLSDEEKTFVEGAQKWLLLTDDEKGEIDLKIKEIGARYLDDEKKDLFLRYWKNKLRRAWFTSVTSWVERSANFNFFDESTEDGFLARTKALKEKVLSQSLNTHDDVVEGDALIQDTLEQLFPTIKGLEGEDRKKELEKLLGISVQEKS